MADVLASLRTVFGQRQMAAGERDLVGDTAPFVAASLVAWWTTVRPAAFGLTATWATRAPAVVAIAGIALTATVIVRGMRYLIAIALASFVLPCAVTWVLGPENATALSDPWEVFVGAIAWTVWTIVLVYKYGQTVGKKVMGIRVVRMDGSRVSFARFFFLRWLAVAVISWIVSVVGAAMHLHFLGNLVSLVDALLIFGAAHRCLHDYIADTQVVTAESSPNATLEGSRRL